MRFKEFSQLVNSMTPMELNVYVEGIIFDFYNNLKQAMYTYDYCMYDINGRVFSLYCDMMNHYSNRGVKDMVSHYVFEDAIRFRMIKAVECFKKLSTIIKIKFYFNTKSYDVMNSNILDELEIKSINRLISKRDATAHELDAYEDFILEQENCNIKRDILDLLKIFNKFKGEYEKRMNIKFRDDY